MIFIQQSIFDFIQLKNSKNSINFLLILNFHSKYLPKYIIKKYNYYINLHTKNNYVWKFEVIHSNKILNI